MNPQSLNRYSYCLNNPLRYTDPSGHQDEGLPPGYKEGALGWTVADEWLAWYGGYWVPINSPDDPTPRLPTNLGDVLAPTIGLGEIGVGWEILAGISSKITLVGEILWLLTLQGDTNPNIIRAEKEKNVTPDQNPGNYRNWRDAKQNKQTGEIWKKDKSGHGGEHYEVYKNKKAYENGNRDRSVWPDGRVREYYK